MVKIMPRYFEPLPTADYIGKVADIEDAEGQFGPQLKWTFDVIAPEEYNDRQIMGWTSAVLSPKSKAMEWVRAALGGQDIDWNQEFDFDEIKGRLVSISLVCKAKPDGSEFNRIEAVRPYRPPRKPNGKPKPAIVSDPDVPAEVYELEQEFAAQATQPAQDIQVARAEQPAQKPAPAAAKPNGKHWIDETGTRVRFWAWTHNDLGLTDEEIHAALGVKSIKEFPGTVEEARAKIEAYSVSVAHLAAAS
jgi:hypothetical protein